MDQRLPNSRGDTEASYAGAIPEFTADLVESVGVGERAKEYWGGCSACQPVCTIMKEEREPRWQLTTRSKRTS